MKDLLMIYVVLNGEAEGHELGDGLFVDLDNKIEVNVNIIRRIDWIFSCIVCFVFCNYFDIESF